MSTPNAPAARSITSVQRDQIAESVGLTPAELIARVKMIKTVKMSALLPMSPAERSEALGMSTAAEHDENATENATENAAESTDDLRSESEASESEASESNEKNEADSEADSEAESEGEASENDSEAEGDSENEAESEADSKNEASEAEAEKPVEIFNVDTLIAKIGANYAAVVNDIAAEHPARVVKSDLELVLEIKGMTKELVAALGGVESDAIQAMIVGRKAAIKFVAPESWEALRPIVAAVISLNEIAVDARLYVNRALAAHEVEIRHDAGWKVLPVRTSKLNATTTTTPAAATTTAPAAATTTPRAGGRSTQIQLAGMIAASGRSDGMAAVSTFYEGLTVYALVDSSGTVHPCDHVGTTAGAPELVRNESASIPPSGGANTGLAVWSRGFRTARAASLNKSVSQDSVVKQVKCFIASGSSGAKTYTNVWLKIDQAQDEGLLG